MPTTLPTDRNGYIHGGIEVEFRDNATNDLLWESSMTFIPQKDDIVSYGVGSGALTAYEVNSVKWEFRKVVSTPEPPDPPVEIPTALCWCVPIVLVTAQ